jgi:hypothetical protein
MEMNSATNDARDMENASRAELQLKIRNLEFVREKGLQALNTPVIDGATREAASREVARAEDELRECREALRRLESEGASRGQE